MPQTIIIPNWQKGGTLSQLAAQYGTTVAELQKANGITDPNQIKEGAKLIIPDKVAPVGSLAGTLPGANPVIPTAPPLNVPPVAPKTLPETQPDQLASFGNLLKTITQRATTEAQKSGLTAVQGMGYDFSKMSPDILTGIINSVNDYKTTPINDVYKQAVDFINKQQTDAVDQLKTLISTGGIIKLNDDQIKKLADNAGYSSEYLMGVKQSLVDEQQVAQAKANKTSEPNLTDAEFSRQAASDMNEQLMSVQGLNKHVSPDDWFKYRQRWIKLFPKSDGSDFDTIFAEYKDPNNQNYYTNLTPTK